MGIFEPKLGLNLLYEIRAIIIKYLSHVSIHTCVDVKIIMYTIIMLTVKISFPNRHK